MPPRMSNYDERDDQRVRDEFGAKLRELRTAHGMSQQEMSAFVGISRSLVEAVETGRKNVTVVTAYRMADALGIYPLDLWPK